MSNRNNRIDSMVESLKVSIYPNTSSSFSSGLKVSLRYMTRVDLDCLRSALATRWETTSTDEVQKVASELEKCGILVRIAKNVWNIPRQATSPLKEYHRLHTNPHVRNPTRHKPGECPRCGYKVDNPRRHNNKRHDPDSCRLNVVKRILEE